MSVLVVSTQLIVQMGITAQALRKSLLKGIHGTVFDSVVHTK